MQYHNILNIEFIHEDFAKTRPFFWISYRENGKKIIERDPVIFPSYFYISTSEVDKISTLPEDVKDNIITTDAGFKSLFNEDVIKLVFGQLSRQQFTTARSHFTKTFEDDVLYNFRYIIDNDITYDKNQRIMYLDIETNLGNNIKNPNKEIISISTYDSFEKRYINFVWHKSLTCKVERQESRSIYYFDTEVAMLVHFLEYISEVMPDIFTGWFINGFDIPYIIARCKLLGVNYNKLSPLNKVDLFLGDDKQETRTRIFGAAIVDLLQIYRRQTYDNKPDNYRLSTVAKHLLKDDKIQHEGIDVLWNTNIPKLLQYNEKDVELCVRIDAKANLLAYFLEVQQIIPIPLESVFMNSRVIDIHLLKKYHNKLVFPSKRKNERVDFEGALTLQPVAGIYKNVAILDFSSLYPSIYRTFNISPETIIDTGDIKIDNCAFKSEPKGIILEVIEELLIKRKEMEKLRDSIQDYTSIEWYSAQNKQGSLKSIINSIYGIMGYANFRLFDTRLPKTICFIGRQLLLFVKDIAERQGYKICGGDTDSIMVALGENKTLIECKKSAEQLSAEINSSLIEFVKQYHKNANIHYLKIDCEKIFKSVMFLNAKKKYSGILMWKKGKDVDELFTRGFEIIRKDMPFCLRPVLTEIFKQILKGVDMSEIRTMLIAEKIKIKQQSYWNIGVTKQIVKNLKDYSSNVQHIRAANYSNKYLNTTFGKADFAKMLFVKVKSGHPQVDVILVDEDTIVPDYITIDWDTFFEKFLHNKLDFLEEIPGLHTKQLYIQEKSLLSYA